MKCCDEVVCVSVKTLPFRWPRFVNNGTLIYDRLKTENEYILNFVVFLNNDVEELGGTINVCICLQMILYYNKW